MLAMLGKVEQNPSPQAPPDSTEIEDVQKPNATNARTKDAEDTLAPPKSKCASYGQYLLNLLAKAWDWVKHNLLFCFFGEKSKGNKKHFDEASAFMDKFFFCDSIKDQKDFLPAFKKELSQEIQDDVQEEMLAILKKINFPKEMLEDQYPGKTEEEVYQSLIDKLLLRPFEETQGQLVALTAFLNVKHQYETN